jgi:CheY-like chemotaxis protein
MKPPDRREIVIADDNPVLLSVLTQIFQESGWIVRTACDGFGALAQIRARMPELLLSDLNMAGMSGFELLSVVRRRHALIPVIAMSGAYTGTSVPHGVAADRFYAKGSGRVEWLLDLVTSLTSHKGFLDSRQSTPIWAPRLNMKHNDPESLLLTCPECLRAFVHSLGKLDGLQDVCCWHCLRVFQFSIVQETCGMDMSDIGRFATPGRTGLGNVAVQYSPEISALPRHL